MFNQSNLKINVNKEELLKILRANRAKHEADYIKAKAGFVKLLEKELEKKLEALRAGKKVALSFKNQKPVSHLGDYDDVIGMLELAADKEISIQQEEYKQWVKDDWNWKRGWEMSNVAYLSAVVGE